MTWNIVTRIGEDRAKNVMKVNRNISKDMINKRLRQEKRQKQALGIVSDIEVPRFRITVVSLPEIKAKANRTQFWQHTGNLVSRHGTSTD